MATKKGSKFDKPVDSVQEVNLGEVVNAEDIVVEVILAVMKILLWEEEWDLVSEMSEYRSNLSQHLLTRPSAYGAGGLGGLQPPQSGKKVVLFGHN